MKKKCKKKNKKKLRKLYEKLMPKGEEIPKAAKKYFNEFLEYIQEMIGGAKAGANIATTTIIDKAMKTVNTFQGLSNGTILGPALGSTLVNPAIFDPFTHINLTIPAGVAFITSPFGHALIVGTAAIVGALFLYEVSKKFGKRIGQALINLLEELDKTKLLEQY